MQECLFKGFDLFASYYTSLQLYPFFLQERKGTKMWVLMRYRGSYMTAVICVIIFCMLLVYQTPVDEVSEGMCACKDCVRQQTHSFWFNELYDLSIQPLLTRENYVLSEDIFKYWKVLICKMTDYFPKTSKIFVGNASPKRCRSCAVIGNSGNLKGSHYGHRIDLHDFVIRINMGPTKGYENDVGSKTTHRFLYPESAMDVDNSTYLVLSPFKILDMEWLIILGRFCANYFPVPFKGLHSHRQCVMILHPVNPAPLQSHQYGNWYHYFEKTSHNIRTGAHSGSFEFDTMMQLYLENKIQVYRGR
uniref:ST3 beta-galactoside alpha-2,3-sialyltransferase 1 n=1 Tax=Sinocyclocheilus rhinocerous TaxID=307959 RepID=A0A673K0D1_9TELE